MRHWRGLFNRIPFGIAAAALATLAVQAPARLQGPSDAEVSPDAKPGWRAAWKSQAGDLCDAVSSFTHRHVGDTPPMSRLSGVYVLDTPDALPRSSSLAPEGPRWAPIDGAGALPERVVLLVHGLDDSGDVWDDLAPAIRRRHELNPVGVARLEYPNDQAIAQSATLLNDALARLFAAGARSVDLVCHSMGGLLARDVLTRSEFYNGVPLGHEMDVLPRPDLRRIILLGTPNLGSPFARLQVISEAREVFWRWIESPDHNIRDLARFDLDGNGEAARDLLPGSAFLAELNARPLPLASQVPITAIVAQLVTIDGLGLQDALSKPIVKKLLGQARAEELLDACRDLTGSIGDGVVSASSARLAGAQETLEVESTHRGMVRHVRVLGFSDDPACPVEPPAIPLILDRLAL